MAYPVPANSIAEITISGHQFGETVMNLWHYVTVGGASTDGVALMNAAVDALLTAGLMDAYQQCWSNEFTDGQVRGQWIYTTRRPPITYPTLYPGLSTDESLPSNVAAVISRKGDLALKGRTGNMHMFAMPVTFVNNNNLTNAAMSAYSNLALRMDDEITLSGGITLRPIILHRADPGLSQQVTGLQVQTTPRTMRRRGVRLGV